MKKVNSILSVFLVLLLCINCSDNETISKKNTDPEIKKPVAKDDSYTDEINTPLNIKDLLKNDLNADLTIVTIVKSESKGTVVKNRDDSFTYTPLKDYVGKDSFKYKVTKRLDATKSDTATVNITVKSAGSVIAIVPIAVNDTLKVIKNTVTVIDNLTKNDTLANNAKITSIDNTGTKGTVTLDETTGKVTYTPATDVVGKDTFTYTICDEATPTPNCATATVVVNVSDVTVVSFNIPADLKDYYSSVTFTGDATALRTELKKLSTDKHSTILQYTDRHQYLYNADADPTNPANVILMYTGESRDKREYLSGNNTWNPQTFNTEHIYPQSKYKGNPLESTIKADLHHLRSCDTKVNSSRGNYPFGDRTDDKDVYGLSGGKWYPGSPTMDFRGDVARMIFYISVTYDQSIDAETVGDLNTLLKWNAEDPVSTFEIQRNKVIQGAQGNRNPFIDNPYLASLVWVSSNKDAENKWK